MIFRTRHYHINSYEAVRDFSVKGPRVKPGSKTMFSQLDHRASGRKGMLAKKAKALEARMGF